MRDILPSTLIDILRDRYLAGVADAEAAFHQHIADEDALTGALGQAIAMRHPITYKDNNRMYSVNIDYRKLRGRGPGAPEKKLGSDGVFQISINDEYGRVIRRKALPFQAKTNWKRRNKSLFEQASLMEANTPGALVIDYTESGFKACTAVQVIAGNGDRKRLEESAQMRPLGQMLSRDFLDCKVGEIGLFYDSAKEIYQRDLNLITTSIVTFIPDDNRD